MRSAFIDCAALQIFVDAEPIGAIAWPRAIEGTQSSNSLPRRILYGPGGERYRRVHGGKFTEFGC